MSGCHQPYKSGEKIMWDLSSHENVGWNNAKTERHSTTIEMGHLKFFKKMTITVVLLVLISSKDDSYIYFIFFARKSKIQSHGQRRISILQSFLLKSIIITINYESTTAETNLRKTNVNTHRTGSFFQKIVLKAKGLNLI